MSTPALAPRSAPAGRVLPTSSAERRPPLPLLAVGLGVALVSLVPLAYVGWSTADLGPGEAARFLWRPRIGELVGNTVGMLVATTVASVVLGVATVTVMGAVERLRVGSMGSF